MNHLSRLLVVCLVMGVVPGLTAQSLGEQIAAVEDGQVRFDFAARPGVCGYGENTYNVRRTNQTDWDADCERGPVRVAITRVAGETAGVKWYVGGRWIPSARAVRQLGSVPALDAAQYLIAVFDAHDDKMGRRALTVAGLAESDQLWPLVMSLARESSRSRRSRRAALNWLAGSAGRRLGDEGQTEDNEVRRQAIFALSQQPKDESVPRLVRIVETHREAGARRQALFWLGQTGDERALPVIEQILRGPRR